MPAKRTLDGREDAPSMWASDQEAMGAKGGGRTNPGIDVLRWSGQLETGLRRLPSSYRRSMTPDALTELLGEIYHQARSSAVFGEGDPDDLQFVAAHFTLIDSQYAIDSYTEVTAFRDYREAYLMKFGLLQALQNQLKSVEEVADAVGRPRRIDRLDGVAMILVTRHIVAGHPLRSNVDGTVWRHFHDRGSVHDPTMIRVMSFAADDPAEWTGRTVMVADLLRDQAAAVETVLRETLGRLPA